MTHAQDSPVSTTREQPTAVNIRNVREAAGLTQAAAATLVGLAHRERWTEYETGKRKISGRTWELFLMKTGGAKCNT